MTNVVSFNFKNRNAKKEFIHSGKTNKYIVDNYMVNDILTITSDELNNSYSRGCITNYIVDGEHKNDEVNVIDYSELVNLFDQITKKEESKVVMNINPSKTSFEEDVANMMNFYDPTINQDPIPDVQETKEDNIFGCLKIESPLKPIGWSLDKEIYDLVMMHGKTSHDMDIKINIKNGKVKFNATR